MRTSINETTRAAIETFLAAGRTKIGVFAQDDEFGQAIIDGAKLAGAELKANVVATAKQPKGQKFEVSTAEQVKALKSAGADAVILGANYQPEAAFIRDSVDDKWNVAYAVMTGESTLLRTLKQHEAKTNKSYTQSPTVAPIAVPDVDDTTYPAVIEYRALMDKRNPKVPDEVRDANYKLTQYNGRSLEGFIEAKILVEALRRAGRDLTRAKLRAAIESIRDWDVGLRAPVTYGPNDNQGLDRVFLLGLRAGKWEPVEDAKSFLKSTSGAASTAAVAAAKPHK